MNSDKTDKLLSGEEDAWRDAQFTMKNRKLWEVINTFILLMVRWCFQCVHWSKEIQLYSLPMFRLLHVNYTHTYLLKCYQRHVHLSLSHESSYYFSNSPRTVLLQALCIYMTHMFASFRHLLIFYFLLEPSCVSCSCCKKSLSGLKTSQTYSSTVLEVRNPK